MDELNLNIEDDVETAELGETKQHRFRRISEKRIQNAAKAIDLLGNCADASYEYSPEDVEKMFTYLQNVLDDTKAKYEKKGFKVFSWDEN